MRPIVSETQIDLIVGFKEKDISVFYMLSTLVWTKLSVIICKVNLYWLFGHNALPSCGQKLSLQPEAQIFKHLNYEINLNKYDIKVNNSDTSLLSTGQQRLELVSSDPSGEQLVVTSVFRGDHWSAPHPSPTG